MRTPLPALLLAFTLAANLCAQEAPNPDETARFLAGLPVRDAVLEPLTRQRAWAEHAAAFSIAWKELEARQLSKIRSWGQDALGEAFAAKDPVFCPFSGPDILYALTFFPAASTYVLAGLEPVGAMPDVEHLPTTTLASGLANLRKSLNSVLGVPFFITREAKVDLRQKQLSGTLPILCVFLARAGCHIEKVELIGLNQFGGKVIGRSPTPGVRIVFTRAGGAAQTLYCFTTDLSNDGITSNPGFIKFCEALGTGRTFVKTASYLMHTSEFSKVRDFLLTHSTTIAQDDSGIPIRDFDAAKWNLRYFGAYSGPIETFKQYAQPDLAAASAVTTVPALPFGFGYRWHAAESSLILATPK